MSICYKRRNSVNKIVSYQSVLVATSNNYKMHSYLSQMLYNLFVLHVHSKTSQSHCIVMPITVEYNTNIHIYIYNIYIPTNLDEYNVDREVTCINETI